MSEKTTATHNVPMSEPKAYEWLEKLYQEADEKKTAYEEAVKATAKKHNIVLAVLKKGIKARIDKEKAKQMTEKMQAELDALQDIIET